MSEKEEVPGKSLKKRACGTVTGAAILAIIELVVIGLVWVGLVHQDYANVRVVLWLVLFGIVGSLVLMIVGDWRWHEAFDHLAVDYLRVEKLAFDNWNTCKARARELENCQKAYTDCDAFITAYRPTQVLIDSVLNLAASNVQIACEKEVELYTRGVGKNDASPNPEIVSEFAEARFSSAARECKAAVKTAKDEFWRLWHLAKDCNYHLKDSWHPYAGIDWKEPDEL